MAFIPSGGKIAAFPSSGGGGGGSGDDHHSGWYIIETGQEVTIQLNKQSVVFGVLQNDGTLLIDGQLILEA